MTSRRFVPVAKAVLLVGLAGVLRPGVLEAQAPPPPTPVAPGMLPAAEPATAFPGSPSSAAPLGMVGGPALPPGPAPLTLAAGTPPSQPAASHRLLGRLRQQQKGPLREKIRGLLHRGS